MGFFEKILGNSNDGGASVPAKPGLKRAIGDRMPDGTIFAGLSPDTQKPVYVLADMPLLL